ncbi:hypothetical protein DPMN_147879 [Dreissena polymorpha]|uniref:Uncharacterized protein n=1 Tax=Dreissena polymorpha TaxID=45954 RepID=A0A9D4J3T1_DREPO|nr:hypothetical protein DPMN_147879 [Dreissena polymorpha]
MQKQITGITCSPYTVEPTRRQIVNGRVSGSDVNVQSFAAVGNKITRHIMGIKSLPLLIKSKERAKSSGNNSAVKITSGRAIDPALVYKRFQSNSGKFFH